MLYWIGSVYIRDSKQQAFIKIAPWFQKHFRTQDAKSNSLQSSECNKTSNEKKLKKESNTDAK